MFQDDINILDIVDLVEWQKIQDAFANSLEVTLQTVFSKGDLLTVPSRSDRLHKELLDKAANVEEFCKDCFLAAGANDPSHIKETTEFKCPLGLSIFAVPIKAVREKAAAHVIIGPVIFKNRKTPAEYAEDAKKFGIQPDDLMDALIEIKVFTYNRIHFITDLIDRIFSYIVQTGYHKKRLGEIAPKIAEMDPMFSRYYEEKILNALLNACALALDADSGSVMVLDKKTNSLHIKVSQKMDKDIVDNTSVKIGEGIAGIVAATAQPLLLPKDKDKKGISDKLKRKNIKSSMVVPLGKISKENAKDLYGVINLNIARKERDFSEKDTALVQELTNLASIALAGIQHADPE
ncbi:MAG: PocR ligand-binding domain-containing protein [Candidatus Omnitrophica bacterium]|nr:PocR ligand-binding domain-containing protein [Candidatus Omnitrophota bacterium]